MAHRSEPPDVSGADSAPEPLADISRRRWRDKFTWKAGEIEVVGHIPVPAEDLAALERTKQAEWGEQDFPD